MNANELLAAIRNLPLPSPTAARKRIAQKEAEEQKAEREHKKLGAQLHALVLRRFRRALSLLNKDKGSDWNSVEARYCGYSVYWGMKPPNCVKPHVALHVRMGRGEGRAEVELSYYPRESGDLDEWCTRWIAWLQAAPSAQANGT